MSESRVRVSEVFYSLQGEGRRVGLPTLFIRLTGCPLRCGYCDTTYAFQGGAWRTIASLVAEARQQAVRHVCVTGGEPLAQRACLGLLSALSDAGFDVCLETSGALPVDAVDPRVARIVDIKTPGSGEHERNHWANLAWLTERDELKFVLVDEADYRWAVDCLRERRLDAVCEVLFSPAHSDLAPRDLADWIVRDRLPVRMQVQLHKLLWGEVPGR